MCRFTSQPLESLSLLFYIIVSRCREGAILDQKSARLPGWNANWQNGTCFTHIWVGGAKRTKEPNLPMIGPEKPFLVALGSRFWRHSGSCLWGIHLSEPLRELTGGMAWGGEEAAMCTDARGVENLERTGNSSNKESRPYHVCFS